MDYYEQRFRDAVRAAMAKHTSDDVDDVIAVITVAASEWASDYGNDRYIDGMDSERMVHFG